MNTETTDTKWPFDIIDIPDNNKQVEIDNLNKKATEICTEIGYATFQNFLYLKKLEQINDQIAKLNQ